MKTNIKLNPNLFWDIDILELDYEKNARQIIERVVNRGSMNDWFEMKYYYGFDRIKEEIFKIRYLDKITLNFLSNFFKISKNKFKCYNTPQSYQKLWNY